MTKLLVTVAATFLLSHAIECVPSDGGKGEVNSVASDLASIKKAVTGVLENVQNNSAAIGQKDLDSHAIFRKKIFDIEKLLTGTTSSPFEQGDQPSNLNAPSQPKSGGSSPASDETVSVPEEVAQPASPESPDPLPYPLSSSDDSLSDADDPSDNGASSDE